MSVADNLALARRWGDAENNHDFSRHHEWIGATADYAARLQSMASTGGALRRRGRQLLNSSQ